MCAGAQHVGSRTPSRQSAGTQPSSEMHTKNTIIQGERDVFTADLEIGFRQEMFYSQVKCCNSRKVGAEPGCWLRAPAVAGEKATRRGVQFSLPRLVGSHRGGQQSRLLPCF